MRFGLPLRWLSLVIFASAFAVWLLLGPVGIAWMDGFIAGMNFGVAWCDNTNRNRETGKPWTAAAMAYGRRPAMRPIGHRGLWIGNLNRAGSATRLRCCR